MEIQRQSGVTLCVNSYGGEIETFAQHIIKASTIDTLKFLDDESFELRDRFPQNIACMANAHALEENTRDVIDPLISKKKHAPSALRPGERVFHGVLRNFGKGGIGLLDIAARAATFPANCRSALPSAL